MEQQRRIHGTWSSNLTFILAATGSAVGLGNIWKFPYITGQNGGGAFVLVYLICIVLIGIPVMMAEVMMGRRGGQSPVNTMHYLTKEAGLGKAWAGIGWMGVVAGLLILSFYSVIAGWALNYIFATAHGDFNDVTAKIASDSFNMLLSNKAELITWHSIFMVMTMGVVIGGVSKGLGVAVRVLMPLLFVLLLVLLGYGIAEGNFKEGFHFLFNFNFEKLSPHGVQVALGHAFFTLSLGMGAIMAYGAYMPSNAPIGTTVFWVALLDTVVALVAGLAIFPIVFANGIEPSEGAGLIFVSLPVAFGNMPGGTLFGTLFFILVTIAAWSSSISLIEPGVAWLIESKRFNRVTANLCLGFIAWFIGLGTVLSFNDWAGEDYHILHMTFFDFLDFLTVNIMLPLGGLFIAIFAGWFMRKEYVRKEMMHTSGGMFNLWYFMVRFLSPLCVFAVFVLFLWDKIAELFFS